MMTQYEVLEMARQTGVLAGYEGEPSLLVIFAKAIMDIEREACAEIAEKQRYAMDISLTSHPAQNGTAVGILNQIRARGEA